MSIVVVGAGLAGGTAVTELREQGYTGTVVVVGAEEHPPYERPPLSKGYLLGNDPIDDAFVHPVGWYAEHDVDLRLGVEATALDTDAHVVHRAPATSAYDGCCWPPGPTPRRLALADDSGVPTALPAHHRGQRPAQGRLREGRADRGGRSGLDRARGRGRRACRRLRGDRLRDGRPAAAAGARPRPSPRRSPTCTAPTASTCASAPR